MYWSYIFLAKMFYLFDSVFLPTYILQPHFTDVEEISES
jgi:hypothetical protein